MASKKISELTPVTPLLTDLVPLDRPTIGAGAPVTGQATLADIQALIGGGGGGGNEYWESSISGEIFATGSLVAITGSIHAQFLSASNGLQVTGSFTQGPGTVASATGHAQGTNTTASGNNAHAEGSGTTSNSFASHAEGYLTNASNDAAHSEGYSTTASGQYSHAEGASTTALGYASHSEGYNTNTTDLGTYSHAEGETTIAGGYGSHAEGQFSVATGSYSHAEGFNTISSGTFSHAEGYFTTGLGSHSHAEGYQTLASGGGSHTEGAYTTASNAASHAEGGYSKALGAASHAEGAYTIADGLSSHAEGWGSATHLRGFTVVYVDSDGVDPAHGVFQLDPVYGDITADIQNATNITTFMVTDGDTAGGFIGDRRVYDFVGTNYEVIPNTTWITCSNPYGMNPQSLFPYAGSIIASLAPLEWQLSTFTTPPDQAITGTISHAEGIESIAIGSGSHAEGFRTLAIGVSKDLTFSNSPGDATWGAHAEGLGTIAYGNASHSEGSITAALGDYSHAEGDSTTASGFASHTEGVGTTSSGFASHAEGAGTAAVGYASHAEGQETIASGSYQHVQGKFNLRNNDFSIFVIGNGTAYDDANRSDVVRVNLGTPGSGSFEVTGSLSVTVGMTGSLSYTPGNGTYWADPDPTNVKEALDRIASLLYTLNSNTPIP